MRISDWSSDVCSSDLSQEYVLVQAWKKAASYIRYHNWFSDTLELDRAAADLPRFVSRLSARLRSGKYETDELTLVPAPKSQRWQIEHEGLWKPERHGPTHNLPLAPDSLSDQHGRASGRDRRFLNV